MTQQTTDWGITLSSTNMIHKLLDLLILPQTQRAPLATNGIPDDLKFMNFKMGNPVTPNGHIPTTLS